MLNLMSFSPSNFAAYAPEPEYQTNEIDDIEQWEQTQPNLSTADKISPLISFPLTSPATTKNIESPSTTISVVKENVEPLPFPQHRPGPIQRPPKLKYSSVPPLSSFLTDGAQSPSTPDVLVEINHLLDRQNSMNIKANTVTSTLNTTNAMNTSATNNDTAVMKTPWTPLSSSEWSSKYDSSWSTADTEHSLNSLGLRVERPFSQTEALNDDSSAWPSNLERARSGLQQSKGPNRQTSTEWNEIFPSPDLSVDSATGRMNSTWLNFLPISETPSVDNAMSNKQDNETNNPFWNLINTREAQQDTTTPWWSKMSSDDDKQDNDKSRWDFVH